MWDFWKTWDSRTFFCLNVHGYQVGFSNICWGSQNGTLREAGAWSSLKFRSPHSRNCVQKAVNENISISLNPIGSIYGISTYIYLNQLNVGSIYHDHGSVMWESQCQKKRHQFFAPAFGGLSNQLSFQQTAGGQRFSLPPGGSIRWDSDILRWRHARWSNIHLGCCNSLPLKGGNFPKGSIHRLPFASIFQIC